MRFAGALAECVTGGMVRYWLSGPAEDGYGPTLDRVLARATVDVTLGRTPSAADAYAACDVVVFPSTWEGFGNPTIESVVTRRPLAAARYPVLAEITAHGLQFFDLDQVAEVARFLEEPNEARLDANLRRARTAFSLTDLPETLTEIFETHGWWSW
ncbi:MAG: glycosyltransferase [Acidimicrobiia bacterium]|nr:glycosyltransferase [Acidimicrobiia bacterium]